MNETELKYTLLSIGLLVLSAYTFYLSEVLLGVPLAILGILFGIRSTSADKPKWKMGILIAVIGIILGYIVATIFLKSITR